MWRISLDIVLLASVYLLPWWISLALLLVGFFVFRLYFEGVIFALIIDLVYAPTTRLGLEGYRFTYLCLALLLLIETVARKFIRAYES